MPAHDRNGLARRVRTGPWTFEALQPCSARINRLLSNNHLKTKIPASYAAHVMEIHDASKETEMNANENTRPEVQEDVVDLGVASIETKGDSGFPTEDVLHKIMPGISEE